MKKEQLAVLQPAIDRGDIKIVSDQHAADWRTEEALKIVENALTQNSDNIQAVVASKDNLQDTVIKDGFATFDEVYANVPADRRPTKR